MASRVVPIDRRTRAVRQVRKSLNGEPSRARRGRPCTVCRAHQTGHDRCEDVRPLIDGGHSRGVTDAELARRVAALCEGWPRGDVPSLSSIRNHVNFHITDSGRIARDLAMERMRHFGETDVVLAEQYLEPLVDVSFMMVMAARDAVATGRVVPKDVSDVVKALDAWARFRPTPQKDGISYEEHNQDLTTLIEIARRIMTSEQYEAFVSHLRAVGREPRPGGDGEET
jgi:hypothetical protein